MRLASVHFKDLELLRGTWRRMFLAPTMVPDGAGGERQATDANGKPLFHARTAFSAGQLRFPSLIIASPLQPAHRVTWWKRTGSLHPTIHWRIKKPRSEVDAIRALLAGEVA